MQLSRVTRELLDHTRAGELTLGRISAAAGLAKSGVLRYAGSREALLLLVMYQEHLGWLDDLASRQSHDVAKDLARTLAARPVLCDLISAAPVLMNRLSPDDAAAVRAQADDIKERLGAVLAPRLKLDEPRLALLTAAIHAFAGTVWGWAAMDSSPMFTGELEQTLSALLRTFIAGW